MAAPRWITASNAFRRLKSPRPPPSNDFLSHHRSCASTEKMALLEAKCLTTSNYDSLPSIRSVCPKCSKKRLLYCYSPTCLSSMAPAGVIPTVSLPIQLVVVHHREEDLSRSTAVHAKVIAPDSTTFLADEHGTPTDPVPAFDSESTVALFPSEHAKTLKELDPETLAKIKSVVLVEGTWVKANAAVTRANISNLVHVKLNQYETCFWRYQRKNQQNDHMLSSIEAIYYFFKEFMEATKGEYDGSCDNLLYLFAWQRSLVEANHADDAHDNGRVLRIKRKKDSQHDDDSRSEKKQQQA
eukprot:TRINITY_DN44713_c0_g1_i2.p1 TRINITY_DN44713_c0_g1~~TRINITY_DN44713_c0_g1_i2.p1  ORF type:complete len:298 (+),score=57.63 TRINITY_DN44713_c0_g1_i2:1097-1990(+)